MTSIYRWVVFVHVASVLLFLLLHGGTMAAAYALKRERSGERIGAMLTVSSLTFDSRGPFGRVFWIDLLVVLGSGIGLTIAGGFSTRIWPWASLVLFIAIFGGMTALGSGRMGALRKAAGLPYIEGERRGFGPPKLAPALPADPAATEAALAQLRPGLLTAIGTGGFALILWLMLFKPL